MEAVKTHGFWRSRLKEEESISVNLKIIANTTLKAPLGVGGTHAKQSCRYNLLDGKVYGKNRRNAAGFPYSVYFFAG